jgi:hypothetical protein
MVAFIMKYAPRGMDFFHLFHLVRSFGIFLGGNYV